MEITRENARIMYPFAFWWPTNLLRGILIVAASLYIAAYVTTALARIAYPFDLECMEGTHLDQVSRLLDHKPMYVPPTLAYAPVMFPPLYFYVSAVAARLVGPGLFPMRLVSFLSSLGCFFLIYRLVRRETSSSFCALLSSGLFLASFRVTDYWLDLARVDSLFLVLMLAAVYVARFQTRLLGIFVSSLLFALAILTKQPALLVALPLGVYFALIGWKEFAVFAAPGGSVVAAFTAYMNHRTGGLYNFYLFDVPGTFFTVKSMLFLFWTRHVFTEFGIACALALFYISSRSSRDERRAGLFYFLVCGGALTSSWIHSFGWGSGPNGRLPSYAVLCVLFGLGADALMRRCAILAPGDRRLYENTLYGVLTIQFLILFYNPIAVIPHASDREAGWNLVARLAAAGGPVYVPIHSHLPVLAGQLGTLHAMNMRAIAMTHRPELTAPLLQEVKQAIREKRFRMIVLDSDWTQERSEPIFSDELLANYDKRETIAYRDSGTLRCYGGLQSRPEFIYLPKANHEMSDRK
jgi:hypothetical protein